MFNLIVAVISIALIAAMAAASIFYGGEAFSNSTAKAQASTLVNNGQQISGAQQLYMIDNSGNREDTIGDFVSGGYLQALPTPPASAVDAGDLWALNAAGDLGFIDLNDTNAPAVCEAIAEQGGANDIGGGGLTAAATPTAAELSAVDANVQFGCLDTAGGDVVFVYKL
jgi:hypothetical protein